MKPEINLAPSRKRERSVELEYDQLVTERAKRRYVTEFLSSQLTSLSLQRNESLLNNNAEQNENCRMEFENNQESNSVFPTRRKHVGKHVVMVTDLDAETDSDQSEEEKNTSLEIPREIRKTIKKIPNELLVPRTENPVRSLVLYQRPSWLPQESFTQRSQSRKKEMMHVNSDIMGDGKLSPIPEDPTSPAIEMDLDFDVKLEGENHKNYEVCLGDDDEVMEL